MKHVLPSNAAHRDPGTNAAIEQPFAALAATRRPRPPHLLVIEAPELTADDVGAYAGPSAETPYLDRFAKSGVRFTEAHAGAPIGEFAAGFLDRLGAAGYATARFDDGPGRTAAFMSQRHLGDWAVYLRLTLEPAGVDEAIGRLTAELRRTEQYRSAALLLVGATSRTSADPRIPTLLAWPGRVPPRQRHSEPISTTDWCPTLLAFAHAGQVPGGTDLSGELLDGTALPAPSGAIELDGAA